LPPCVVDGLKLPDVPPTARRVTSATELLAPLTTAAVELLELTCTVGVVIVSLPEVTQKASEPVGSRMSIGNVGTELVVQDATERTVTELLPPTTKLPRLNLSSTSTELLFLKLPDVGGEFAQHRRVADVKAVAEEGFQHAVVVGRAGAVFLGELEALPRQVRVRLRRHGGQLDRHAHPPGDGVDGLPPRPPEVVSFGPQGLVGVGP